MVGHKLGVLLGPGLDLDRMIAVGRLAAFQETQPGQLTVSLPRLLAEVLAVVLADHGQDVLDQAVLDGVAQVLDVPLAMQPFRRGQAEVLVNQARTRWGAPPARPATVPPAASRRRARTSGSSRTKRPGLRASPEASSWPSEAFLDFRATQPRPNSGDRLRPPKASALRREPFPVESPGDVPQGSTGGSQ